MLYGNPFVVGSELGMLQVEKSGMPPPELRFQVPAQILPVGDKSTSWLLVVE